MNAVALRGLLSRKLRTALTAIAIILGVSMISGTYILTDTMNASFAQIFQKSDSRIDAIVTGKAALTSRYAQPPPLPASLLATVAGTPGVTAAEGEIADTALVYDLNGKNLGSTGGAPTLLFSVTQPRFQRSAYVHGRKPRGSSEIGLDQDTVDRHHLQLGQKLRVASATPARLMTLVGIFRFGSAGSIGGATLVSMDLATAQRMTDKVGKYDQIVAIAARGVGQADLAHRIAARIPPGLKRSVSVKTSAQYTTDQSNQIANALGFLTIALLVFGGIAVFVGAFIIFNTFSITVAQRAREFALLRTLGATRSQVLRSVILEAFVVGLAASVVGLLAGVGIARALNRLFVAFGIDIPATAQVINTRTVVVGLLVGTIVTVASGMMPAVRATRVPPIAALREGAELPRGRFSRYLPWVALVLTVLGVGLLVLGIFGSFSSTGSRLSIIGLGAVLLFVGVAMLSPRFVTPLATVLGWPVGRVTAITGRLAQDNVARNPSRTAVTAAALMVGLALVGFVTIFAAELRKTAHDAVSRELAGTFTVYNQTALTSGALSPALASLPGVSVVSPVQQDVANIRGVGAHPFHDQASVTGIQPATVARVYNFTWKTGSAATLHALGPHDVLISDSYASDHSLTIGSRLAIITPVNRRDILTVRGIYKAMQLFGPALITTSTFMRDWATNKVLVVIVQAAPGADTAALKRRITALAYARFPGVQAYSQADIKARSDQQVNTLLGLIYALLAMSVLVSLFGIINTLVLSIYERTREIGMLRAIGTTRTQVRWMVRWESVITSVIGAILGLLLGIVLAVLITAGLASQNIEFTLPIGQLLIWVVFAVLFGIVAAAFPARRAARLDVLQAISYE